MADRLSKLERSRHMARIRGKNTGPERHLRSALHRMGVRFRLHRKDLAGRPDIVVSKYQAVIFVHGCFWHRHQCCVLAYQPKTRTVFWNRKFEENVQRDEAHVHSLLQSGWRLGIVWECSLRSVDKRMAAARALAVWLGSRRTRVEIPPRRSTGARARKRFHGAAAGRGTARVGTRIRRARQPKSNTRSSSI